eukprot:scaffold220282_cov34-Prasinocladus_malaysianus.AAC.1
MECYVGPLAALMTAIVGPCNTLKVFCPYHGVNRVRTCLHEYTRSALVRACMVRSVRSVRASAKIPVPVCRQYIMGLSGAQFMSRHNRQSNVIRFLPFVITFFRSLRDLPARALFDARRTNNHFPEAFIVCTWRAGSRKSGKQRTAPEYFCGLLVATLCSFGTLSLLHFVRDHTWQRIVGTFHREGHGMRTQIHQQVETWADQQSGNSSFHIVTESDETTEPPPVNMDPRPTLIQGSSGAGSPAPAEDDANEEEEEEENEPGT